MIERPISTTVAGSGSDGRPNIGMRPTNRRLQREPLGKTGRTCGCKRTSRAVGMAAVDARSRKTHRLIVTLEQKVNDRIAAEVPADL